MFCTRAGIIIYECKFYVFTRNQGRVKDMRENEKFYGKELTTIENFKTATTTTTNHLKTNCFHFDRIINA